MHERSVVFQLFTLLSSLLFLVLSDLICNARSLLQSPLLSVRVLPSLGSVVPNVTQLGRVFLHIVWMLEHLFVHHYAENPCFS